MARKPKLPANYEDNPEWTEETAARAVPIDALPELAALFPKRGRPKAAVLKEPVSIRLSPDVLKKFKATGPGWQTMIDDVLKNVSIRRVKPTGTLKRSDTTGKIEIVVYRDKPTEAAAPPPAKKRA